MGRVIKRRGLLAVTERHHRLRSVHGKIAEIDLKLRLAPDTSVHDAGYLPGHRDSVANLICSCKGDLLEKDGRVLDPVSGFLYAQISSRVNPDFALEQAHALLLRRDRTHMGPAASHFLPPLE